MNALVGLDKEQYEQNELFATLDATTKAVKLVEDFTVSLTDTVGFIQNLPTELIKAFKSTLEESANVDLLIHVVDASNPHHEIHEQTVLKIMEDLKLTNIPVLNVYNKMDIAKSVPLDVSGHEVVYLSAKTGENINVLVEKIREKIFGGRVEMTLLIPYQRGDITSYLCENAQIFSMEYEEEGTLLHGKLEREDALRYGSFAVDPGEKSEE